MRRERRRCARAAAPWLGAIALAAGCASEPPPPADPAAAELVGADVARFWVAFDEGIGGTDAELRDALQRTYLDPGTPSLDAFVERRIGSADALAETVRRNRAYYESIRASSLASADGDGFWPGVQAAFVEIERVEPDAVFPPVALLIGRMNSGGTTSRRGILIGLELRSRTPDSPIDTLTSFERAAARGPERLTALIVHEHVHVLQEELGSLRSGDDRPLLERALVEGVADFVTERLTGTLPREEPHAFGRAHEAELWSRFSTAMDGTDISGWLYDASDDPEAPGDLGYFVGYRIAEAYAARRGDPEAAIRELIRADDARAILDESGYAGAPP